VYPATATAAAARERRLAWQILRDSLSARRLAELAEADWPVTSRDDLERESDAEYFDRRAGEERRAANQANGSAARKAHKDLAQLHRLVADASRDRKANLRFGSIEHREALLDDALNHSFPASDPPAIIAPARPGRWH
jgi:hypothetical protein